MAAGLGDGSICFYLINDSTSEFEVVALTDSFKDAFSESVTSLE